MPIRKPTGLITRAETKEDRAKREETDALFRTTVPLPKNVPPELTGSKIAIEAWKRTMKTYRGMKSEIVSGLDYDVLVEYCLTIQELADLRERYIHIQDQTIFIERNEKVFRKAGIKAVLEEWAVKAWSLNDSYELLRKIGLRLDQKRDRINKLRHALYLTPRARTGVAPAKKDPEKDDDDPMGDLLRESDQELNGHVQPQES
jgi:hypothetical protein